MTDNGGHGRGPMRIGDAERDEAVRELGEHFAAGRLTEEEHSERTEQAYAARTQQDLDGLFADLPGHGGQAAGEQGTGQWGPPWAQHGPPPWAAWAGQRGGPGGKGGPGFGKGLRWLPVPFLVLAVLATGCAISKGFFPIFAIPLLAIAVTFFVLNKRGHFGGPGRQQGNRA